MNEMWGNAIQYHQIYWPWPIAIYLFLAGISAGSIIVALLVKWNHHENVTSTIWDAMVKAGAVIAPLTITIGLLLLVVDLGKPFSFYWLMLSFNPTSVMSLGVLALCIYMPFTYIFLGLIFEDEIKKIPLVNIVSPIISFIKGYSGHAKKLEYVLLALAVVVGAYTGFLLSVTMSFPIWNSPILPILFLTSGLGAGIAGNILVGLAFFKSSVNKESIKYLLTMDLRVVLIEIPLLIILFIGMINLGGIAKVAAIQAISTGVWAWVLWIGVIGFGLLTPLIIAATALRNHAYNVGFIIANSIIILSGVLMLRFYIVYAGQIFTGV